MRQFFIQKGEGNTERLERLGNGISVTVSDIHTFGHDALLLARFARVHSSDRVCDLGTGCGILPLVLAADGIVPTVDAVECSAAAAAMAARSFEQNRLSPRFTVHCADWNTVALPDGRYDAVLCNPPYFAADSGALPPDDERRIARHETGRTLAEVCSVAARLLRGGGHFYLCHRPERLADVIETLRRSGLEPKRLQTVQARIDCPPFLLLCDAVKGGKNGLTVLPPQLLESQVTACPEH